MTLKVGDNVVLKKASEMLISLMGFKTGDVFEITEISGTTAYTKTSNGDLGICIALNTSDLSDWIDLK